MCAPTLPAEDDLALLQVVRLSSQDVPTAYAYELEAATIVQPEQVRLSASLGCTNLNLSLAFRGACETAVCCAESMCRFEQVIEAVQRVCGARAMATA